MWKNALEMGMFLGSSALHGLSLSGQAGVEWGFAVVVTLAAALPTVWRCADAFMNRQPQAD